MVDIIEISAMVAAAGVLVGVVYYILDIRYNMRAREMEICQLVISDVNSEQGVQRWTIMMTLQWKDNEDFIEKYTYSNPEMMSKWVSQFMVWETMGVLIKSKVVTAEKIYALGGWAAIRGWQKYEDIIQDRRDVAWGRDFLSNAEFFAQEMLKIKTKNDASFKDSAETHIKTMETLSRSKTS